ncbi:MAG: amino acid ABC transporter permease [Alphaproteobacteria bacterium]
MTALKWSRENLFSTPFNSALTLFALWVVWLIVPPVLDWMIFSAIFEGDNRDACLVPGAGACWPFVEAKWGQFIYGRYPAAEIWRVDLAMGLGAFLLLWAAWERLPLLNKYRRFAVVSLLLPYPILTFWLLSGGMGLEPVSTDLWGGLLVTLVVAITGIAASLPLGILLALARRSHLPVLRWMSIAFIEFWRGVPLITVLFMASVMLPLFLPEGVTFDKLLRCLIGVALFASAYMAEVIRGGLQAIPKGQFEAAEAMGLTYTQSMRLIVLPQALRMVIPGIVNTFIGLFKDTTLVLIIGLFDLLGIIQLHFTDAGWATPQTHNTGYAVAAMIFWIFCFGMSRYSQNIENRLKEAQER